MSIFLSFHCEAFRLQVLVVPSAFRGKLQDAVIRIGHAFLVEDGISLSPDHILGFLVCQDFHGAFQHHAFIPDQPLAVKADAAFGFSRY